MKRTFDRVRGVHPGRGWGLVLAIAGVLQGEAQAAPEFTLQEVAPGIHVHQGKHVSVDDPARGDSANIGFIVGERCVAVIDTGGSLQTGNALRAAVARTTPRPVCFVVNTHAHFDHVLGNPAFVGAKPRFVGHQHLPSILAESEGFFRERFPAESAGAPSPMFVADGQWVESEATLDLGERPLLLRAEKTAHSQADLTVLDTKTGTLWSGDLVFVERLPVLDGSVRGWLEWIAATGQHPPSRVVPGHGPPAVPWQAAVRAEFDYLQALKSQAKKAVDAGDFLEDVAARAEKQIPAGWLVTGPHPRNVTRAFREFEWN